MLYHSIYPQVNTSPVSKQQESVNKLQPVKFPEDVQVIIRSDRNDYGNLYIGNLEAAQNV